MTDLNERVEILENAIDELTFDLRASQVAINVLSTVINSMSSEPGLLENAYEQTRSSAPLVRFNHPTQAGDEEELTRRILGLLSVSAPGA